MNKYNIFTSESEIQPDCCLSESMGSQVELKFVNEMIELILDIFSINWGAERTYIIGLLRSHLNDILISGEDSIIEQIENYTADTFIKEMKCDLKKYVDFKDVKVNSNYRVHAKLNDAINKIKKTFEELQKENEELKEKLNSK